MIVPSGLLLVKVDVLGQGLRKSHDLGCELVFIVNEDLWQFRLDGCVMGGHESDVAATISQRPRIACSHHPCWILHNGSHQPAGVPDNDVSSMLITKGGRPSGAAANAKFIHWKKTRPCEGPKMVPLRHQKVTRILFLGIYAVLLLHK